MSTNTNTPFPFLSPVIIYFSFFLALSLCHSNVHCPRVLTYMCTNSPKRYPFTGYFESLLGHFPYISKTAPSRFIYISSYFIINATPPFLIVQPFQSTPHVQSSPLQTSPSSPISRHKNPNPKNQNSQYKQQRQWESSSSSSSSKKRNELNDILM